MGIIHYLCMRGTQQMKHTIMTWFHQPWVVSAKSWISHSPLLCVWLYYVCIILYMMPIYSILCIIYARTNNTSWHVVRWNHPLHDSWPMFYEIHDFMTWHHYYCCIACMTCNTYAIGNNAIMEWLQMMIASLTSWNHGFSWLSWNSWILSENKQNNDIFYVTYIVPSYPYDGHL